MTIEETIKQLQESIGAALPGMNVTVNISLTSANSEDEISTVAELTDANDIANPEVDLQGLRDTLNAYVGSAGKDKAYALVEKYTGGSRSPADIPADKYNDILDEMDGIELSPRGEAA